MKIQVTTNKYEYQGLTKDSVHTVSSYTYPNRGKIDAVSFKHLGKDWRLTSEDFAILSLGQGDFGKIEAPEGKVKYKAPTKTPITSDGGSSTYYDIEIDNWLLHVINERAKSGKAFIKTEEIIEAAFSNDFDAANAFKSLIRAWGAFNGGGKAGNTVDYECNKIAYSVNKLKFRHNRSKEDVQ